MGKTADQLAAEKAATDANAKAVRGPIAYNITLGGRTHQVKVEPA